MSLVAASSVAAEAGKTFDPDQLEALQDKVDAIQYELESLLNRVLERREITQSYEVMPQYHVNLRGPVVDVLAVLKEDAATSADWMPVANNATVRDALYIVGARPGESYEVTYLAGDKTPDPAVIKLIRDVATRNVVVGVAVAVGALSSINVEGASIGLGPTVSRSSDSAEGSFSPSELKSVRHLRRRVSR